MDQKGSLVNTSVKIYPSKKLINFIVKEKFQNYVPTNVKKLLKDETFMPLDQIDCNTKQVDCTTKHIDINLDKSDLELLNKISDKLNKNKKEISPEENIEKVNANLENVTNNSIENGTKTTNDNLVLPNFKQNVYSDNINDLKFEQTKDLFLTVSDIDWLYLYITEQKECHKEMPNLHDLLEDCKIELPDNEVIKRNPILEARCVKLRAQQEAREYRKMTKSVDNVRMKFPEDSISYQLKQLNRQLIAIGQFIISIFAGFLFGFKGVEWMIGNLDFGFRLLLGVMCALIIALAEIYFLAKKLNEELSVPETTQLGGPPRFVDESLNEHINKRTVTKPHQD